MAHCPYGVGFNDAGKTVPLYCGKWSCEHCGKENAKRWAWRTSLHINDSAQEAYFWTLTLRPGIQTAYQGFRALPTLWNALRMRMSRATGKWTYLAFVECHPRRSKVPHFHIISLTRAPVVGAHVKNPIKDLAWAAGFGYMATEEIIQGWKAAWYVAKYASKHDPSIPRNFRRCRASRDWAKLPDRDLHAYLCKSRNEHTWEFIQRVADKVDKPAENLFIAYRAACNMYEVGFSDDSI